MLSCYLPTDRVRRSEEYCAIADINDVIDRFDPVGAESIAQSLELPREVIHAARRGATGEEWGVAV
jgi:hypothetical protein